MRNIKKYRRLKERNKTMLEKFEMFLALWVFRIMYVTGITFSFIWIFFYVYDTSHGLR